MTPSSTSATGATGQPITCPECSPSETSNIASSASDSPCPRCGYLIWFAHENFGNYQIVVKPMVRMLQPDMVEKLIREIGHAKQEREGQSPHSQTGLKLGAI